MYDVIWFNTIGFQSGGEDNLSLAQALAAYHREVMVFGAVAILRQDGSPLPGEYGRALRAYRALRESAQVNRWPRGPR